MGLLVEGKWSNDWYDTKKTDGRFVRQESSFRHHIGQEPFPAESNRYHLYLSHACPWAHRVAIFLILKDLESHITVSFTQNNMAEQGWALGFGGDPINEKQYLHQVYTLAQPNYSGRVTVPVLWDKKSHTIVNNESSEIIRMFNKAFDSITGNTLDLYPQKYHDEIDAMNQYIYDRVNNGVYKVGFATEQKVYDEEVTHLFEALESLELRLAKQRYLIGNFLTEADIRLFTTLVRFDPVYVGHFKCNLRRIFDYHHLSHYIRDIYQTQTIAKTLNIQSIKEHYYLSHTMINPTQIIPQGPNIDYHAAHDRNRFVEK